MTVVHRLEHELTYRYEPAVQGSVMTLFVRPREDRRQRLRRFALETDPPGPVSEFVDGFGNRGHFFTRHRTHAELRIVARSLVELSAPASPTQTGEPDPLESRTPESLTPELHLMLQPSRFVRPRARVLAAFLDTHGIRKDDDGLRGLRRMASSLFRIFEYAPGATAADSPIDRILETGRGVCQDYAHVMASIARRWGVPARYVSGYLAPGAGDSGSGESHAWVECWLPELGWIGIDPTNDCRCDDRHVRVALGRDYADVPPSRGIFHGQATSTLTTRVTVTRDYTPHHRRTKPCDTTNASSGPAASRFRPSSGSRPSPARSAASPPPSAPTWSAATSGVEPTSGSPSRSSLR